MRIDAPGQHEEPVRIDHHRIRAGLERGADLGDGLPDHANVGRPPAVDGDDLAPAHQDLARPLRRRAGRGRGDAGDGNDESNGGVSWNASHLSDLHPGPLRLIVSVS